jgi:hypothetical protein
VVVIWVGGGGMPLPSFYIQGGRGYKESPESVTIIVLLGVYL